MSVRILEGDALAVLRTLPSDSIQCVVTSPPYYSLRAYNTAPKIWGGDPEHAHAWGELSEGWNNRAEVARLRAAEEGRIGGTANHHDYRRISGICPCGAWRGELGLEPTPAMFIEHLVAVFEEVRRVLRPDGVVFCNLGDSYAGSGKGPTGHSGLQNAETRQGFGSGYLRANGEWSTGGRKSKTEGIAGIPAKNLLLIPERFALAMQGFSAVPGAGLLQMADELASAREADDWQMVEAVESQLRVWAAWSRVFDGWWVRSRIAWCKTSAMPESVVDRPTSAWEHIYLFTKSARYFWDQTAVRQASTSPEQDAHNQRYAKVYTAADASAANRQPGNVNSLGIHSRPGPGGASLRNFWLLGPEPSSLNHFASFVSEIPRRCIKAATSEKGACPACGAPWVRVVERTKGDTEAFARPKHIQSEKSTLSLSGHAGSGWTDRGSKVRDTGWQPSCSCPPADPAPCVVLDPFAGSGTTGLVASQLGRSAILIELSPVYAEMARKRLAGDAPMFTADEVTVETPAVIQPDLFAALLPEHQAGPAPEMGGVG